MRRVYSIRGACRIICSDGGVNETRMCPGRFSLENYGWANAGAAYTRIVRSVVHLERTMAHIHTFSLCTRIIYVNAHIVYISTLWDNKRMRDIYTARVWSAHRDDDESRLLILLWIQESMILSCQRKPHRIRWLRATSMYRILKTKQRTQLGIWSDKRRAGSMAMVGENLTAQNFKQLPLCHIKNTYKNFFLQFTRSNTNAINYNTYFLSQLYILYILHYIYTSDLRVKFNEIELSHTLWQVAYRV